MSQRLAELHRQRQLLEDHLAWLNREIAAELIAASPKSPPAASPIAATTPASASAPSSATTAGSAGATSTTRQASVIAPPLPGADLSRSLPAEALIDDYRVAPDALRDEVRKGCFLYLALAFGLLILGIAVLYFLFRL